MAVRNDIKYLKVPKIGSQKKKYCRFKKNGIKYIDYKDEQYLLTFINPQGKILPRRLSGNSEYHRQSKDQDILLCCLT